MSADGRLLLLDTSVAVHVLRGKATGLALDRAYGLRKRPDRPLLSIISVGEILAFAARRGWSAARLAEVERLVRELVVVDVRSQAVLERYAEIDSFLVKRGRRIGDNDTWIAATAAATGAVLLTTDKDFDALDGVIDRVWFDPHVDPEPAT